MVQLTILVVDDDPSIRRLLGAVLGGEGFRVREAQDGQAALAIVAQEVPDLILLDLAMPVMDGQRAMPTFARTGTATSRS